MKNTTPNGGVGPAGSGGRTSLRILAADLMVVDVSYR
jgi:hypothetical protein